MGRRNLELVDKKQNGMDRSFILLLSLISVTTLLLLAFRDRAELGTL